MQKTPTQNQINTLLNYYKERNYPEAEKLALSFTKKFPDDSFAWKVLGVVLKQKGKLSQSIIYFKKALSINPQDFETYYNLGNTYKVLNEFQQSENNYKKAISLNPNFTDAYNNLGAILRELGRLEESETAYKKAIQLKEDFTDAYNNLGVTLRELRKLEESKSSYLKAISLNPNFADAYNNLGFTLRELGRLEESENTYKKAISLNPNFADAYNNLGFTLRELGRLEESEASFKKAIELRPDFPDAYNNMSLTLLSCKNFKKAFELSEWRWKTKLKIGDQLKSTKPLWNGESNSSVFVWKEQGIGDEIMFCSILPELKTKSKKIILNCDKRLIPIFRRSLSRDIVYESNRETVKENKYDSHIPMGSLPRFFRNDLESFSKSSAGYLKADNNKTSVFITKLKKQLDVKIIGVSWYTNSDIQMSSFRNIKLKELISEINHPNIKFINLQYGDVSKELNDLKDNIGKEIIDFNEINKKNDIDDLASLMCACDLIITIDNSIVHLAGSLGIKTKALLPFSADSRWGQKSAKSYLYDSVSLYRQTSLGDWDSVLKKLKKDILL